jgi:hypothetical protein
MRLGARSSVVETFKSAVDSHTVANTPNLEWAKLSRDFLQLMAKRTILGQLPGVVRLPINIKAPIIAGGAVADFVPESAPVPVVRLYSSHPPPPNCGARWLPCALEDPLSLPHEPEIRPRVIGKCSTQPTITAAATGAIQNPHFIAVPYDSGAWTVQRVSHATHMKCRPGSGPARMCSRPSYPQPGQIGMYRGRSPSFSTSAADAPRGVTGTSGVSASQLPR